MLVAYALLTVAIGTEVAATSALPRAESFTRPGWSLFVVAGYGISAWLLAVVVNKIPVSTVYAVWSGVGTALVAMVGVLWLGEDWSFLKGFALTMIIVGLVLLNLETAH